MTNNQHDKTQEYSFSFKNYIGSVNWDDSIEMWHGTVTNIKDIITFESSTLTKIPGEFAISIEDYISSCLEDGCEPQEPPNDPKA